MFKKNKKIDIFRMNFIHGCDFVAEAYWPWPMPEKMTTDLNFSSPLPLRQNYKINTRYLARSPAKLFTTCSNSRMLSSTRFARISLFSPFIDLTIFPTRIIQRFFFPERQTDVSTKNPENGSYYKSVQRYRSKRFGKIKDRRKTQKRKTPQKIRREVSKSFKKKKS